MCNVGTNSLVPLPSSAPFVVLLRRHKKKRGLQSDDGMN